MSFNISLSGLNAAQKDLDVTGNNIANASTIGFKQSRAEFADVFSNSVFANTKTQVGSGVNTAAVSQQFSQGALQSTNNSLDLAIKGDGFFILSPEKDSLERTYTRAGAFQINDEGFVTNSLGDYLQVYGVDDSGTPKAVSVNSTDALKIPTEAGKPTKTSNINESINLPADAKALDPASFDPDLSATYNSSTSVIIYDSLGVTHTLTQYFVKDLGAENNITGVPSDPTNVWRVFNYVDEQPVDIKNGYQTGNSAIPNAATLVFTPDGEIDNSQTYSSGYRSNLSIVTEPLGTSSAATPAIGTYDSAGILPNGVDPTQTLTFNLSLTQYASSFQISSLFQDGATVGQLTNVSIGSDGIVAATYSNGTTEKLGMVALAKFSNPQGLTQVGDTSWKESQDSGEAVPGTPGVGTFGGVNSSALESSNTDLSTELVDLIAAQRNYQANSRALEVNSTLQDTILQIR